ncbi:hypothetical protein VPH35_139657 [Triticum aestivum]
MRGSRTDPVDINSDGSTDSSSDEHSNSSSDGCADSSSDEGMRMSSDEVMYISSDEGRHISSDEGGDTSSDESVYTSSDEGVYTSSDEDSYRSFDGGAHTTSSKGVHKRMMVKKPWKVCMSVCDRPKHYTVGYNPDSNGRWMYSKNLKMSMCARKRLSHYIKSVKPAIGHYVCEMNKTFTKAGQRMYFSTSFTKEYLVDFITTPVDGVKIKLSVGRCARRVRLINGVDNRAAITHNWSDFAKEAKLTKGEICVFSIQACKGKPEFTVHKI